MAEPGAQRCGSVADQGYSGAARQRADEGTSSVNEWLASLFGIGAARPASSGTGYQAMPTSSNIEDRRSGPADYANRLRSYGEIQFGSGEPPVGDRMRQAAYMANPNMNSMFYGPGDYSASYNRRYHPQVAAYQRSNVSPSNALPVLFPHQPTIPGEPGYSPHGFGPPDVTPPFEPPSGLSPDDFPSAPSPSGPHGPWGDPDRPGVPMGTTLNSMPGWGQ